MNLALLGQSTAYFWFGANFGSSMNYIGHVFDKSMNFCGPLDGPKWKAIIYHTTPLKNSVSCIHDQTKVKYV
jgi:hypothetical protein